MFTLWMPTFFDGHVQIPERRNGMLIFPICSAPAIFRGEEIAGLYVLIMRVGHTVPLRHAKRQENG